MRWLTAGKRGVAHAVHEEATGWSRTEVYGSIIFLCGFYSNEAWVTPDSGKHCKRCEKVGESK